MQNEGRKIMHLPEFRASVTCVRVPVYRAHSVAVSAEFEKKFRSSKRAKFWRRLRDWNWSMNRKTIVTRCR